MAGHPIGSFEPTQPQEDHQRRLQEQIPRWYPPYVPNAVPAVVRMFYALLALTWTAWAMIGLLSGHMFFMVSRRGMIHFEGLAAMFFCAAVVLAVFLCVLPIIDHYDRRNNEVAYKRMRKAMAWAAVMVLATALTLGYMSSLNNQVWARGLLDGMSLADVGRIRWLAEHLGPLREQLRLWVVASLMWFMFCAVIGKGWLSGDGVETSAAKHPLLALVLIHVVVTPTLVAFGLNLLHDIATGELANSVKNPDELPKRLAWVYSMFVAVLGAGLLLAFVTLMALLRAAGLIAGPEEAASNV